MFWVGVIDGEVDDGPAVVVALDVDVVVVVVEVDGLLLPLLPQAAVNAPAAMIATPPAAAAMGPAFNPDLMSVSPIVRRLMSDTLRAIYGRRPRRVRWRNHVSNHTPGKDAISAQSMRRWRRDRGIDGSTLCHVVSTINR